MRFTQQAFPGKMEMALWRSRDVDDIGLGLRQELGEIVIIASETQPVAQLSGHELLEVANCHEFAARNAPDVRRVRIYDLAAANDCDLKHVAFSACSPQNTD